MSESSHTTRVSQSTHELLRELADRTNATITSVVDEAVRDFQRRTFWADFHFACQGAQAKHAA